MHLKKLILSNFKGIRDYEVEFGDGINEIKGQNGSGKTTIATMYYWIFADVDYDLNSNPNVRPDSADNGIVTKGEAVIELGGKEISFVKIQKVKSKTGNDGKIKTTKTNSFEVNGVPKSQRDAFKYLEDLGFDAEKFLPLSHPEMFLKGMSEKKGRTGIRDVLFGMASEVTDIDVAKKTGLAEIAGLLEQYSKEEIVAMQNATKRKIASEYGKNGEVIDHRVDGLNAGKVEVDGEAARQRKSEIESRIQEVEKKVASVDDGKANSELNKQIAELTNKRSKHISDVNKEVLDFNWKNRSERNRLENEIATNEAKIKSVKNNIVDAESTINRMEQAVREKQAEYKTVKASKFDDSKAVCPTCKRRFTAKRVEEIKANFEGEKATKLVAIVNLGKQYGEQRDKAKKEKETYEKRLKELTNHGKNLEAELSKIPQDREQISEDDITKSIDSEIEKLREQFKRDDDSKKSELMTELASLRIALNDAVSDIANAENNDRIDKQIEALQEKRIEYEQARLDCDRILDEVNQLEMAKNEMLTEQINSHFKLVKWVLFERQANGEILTDRCTPCVDGLSMVDSANTGRVILGKLDICSSLQKFYGQEYPIFLDNAESITSNTSERIEIASQLIMLSAVDGKELTVN